MYIYQMSGKLIVLINGGVHVLSNKGNGNNAFGQRASLITLLRTETISMV